MEQIIIFLLRKMTMNSNNLEGKTKRVVVEDDDDDDDNAANHKNQQVQEIVHLSMLYGKLCSFWHAEEALRPGRGNGKPKVAIQWLFIEGGYDFLERTRKFKIWKQYISNHYNEDVNKNVQNNDNDDDYCNINSNSELELLVGDDDDNNNNKQSDNLINLEDQLKHFASIYGIHETIVKNAINHCNTFESGCDWILTQQHFHAAANTDTIMEPKIKRQRNQKGKEDCHYLPNNTGIATISTALDNEPNTNHNNNNNNNMIEKHSDHSHQWICKRCTLKNDLSSKRCDACELPSPFDKEIILQQEELSKVTMNVIPVQDTLEVMIMQSEQRLQSCQLQTATNGLDVPYYWDPFPPGQTTLERELITNSPLDPREMDERDQIIKIFIDGGMEDIKPNQVVSLKRIQNLPIWQRYAAQKNIIASKPSNEGNPNVQYLFHGPRDNTYSILNNGFIGQYGISKPYGTWTHTSSIYCSKRRFVDFNPLSGGYRIFICQAIVGTPGRDNGSGRRPNEVYPSILADCHNDGGKHVFYEDSQLYPEYLIEWVVDT